MREWGGKRREHSFEKAIHNGVIEDTEKIKADSADFADIQLAREPVCF